jgi:hypothetical protein
MNPVDPSRPSALPRGFVAGPVDRTREELVTDPKDHPKGIGGTQ